jgi:type III pantothenate kinase
MLLCVDIGNSAIKFGVFDGEDLTLKFSIPTDRELTVEHLSQQIGDRVGGHIDSAIVCSVVPEVVDIIRQFIKSAFQVEARFVKSTEDLGLTIDFSVASTGADRVVNAFAAAEKYGTPCVVVSFGTATTIDVVNAKREYLGGLIAPGMKVNAQALAIAASQLPEVELAKPYNVIAETTETAIQSGIVYGHIEMVKGLLRRVADELGDKPKIIATGGWAEMLAGEIGQIDTVEQDLLLIGLNLIVKQAVSDRIDGRRPSS